MSSSAQETPRLSERAEITDQNSDPNAPPEINWAVPPKSLKSRMGRRNAQREKSHEQQFLHRLQHAFDDVDIEQTGNITLDQWTFSNIREVIHDGNLSETDFINYFKRIDSNCDDMISWNELVTYLMNEMNTVDLKNSNEASQFIQKISVHAHLRSQVHREMVSQICCCQRTGEYITLSSDSIRFWDPADLTFKRCLTEPGLFGVMLVLENLLTLAIATTNRRLIFYDLDELQILPVEISASPSPHRIKKMTQRDARKALHVLGSTDMPLYNIPNVLATAELSVYDNAVQFFVGDDQGTIEAFKLAAPKRRQGMDYHIERIARLKIHQGGITQISTIKILECYASSSFDCTVKMWSFFPPTGSFNILRTFSDQQAILSFNFSSSQKVLATCGISRDAFVWSISPAQKIFKLGAHYNQVQQISDFITSTGEKYLMTMTNKKEFRLWDAVNYRMVREWSDPTPLRPENHYGAAMFDYRRHALITAACEPVKWAEDVSALNESLEPVTHSHQIVATLYSEEFDQVITVDSISSIKVWNVANGKNASSHTEPWSADSCDIATSTLDMSGRRLITSNFRNVVQIWNYNSGLVIDEPDLGPSLSLTTILECFYINNRELLIRAGWDKTIKMFCELEKGEFELYREYKGHKSDISAVAPVSNGLISGSVHGEVFYWSLDTSKPLAITTLDHKPTIECMICREPYVFIGDSNGFLNILMLPRLNIIESFSAHSIVKQHSLSSIEFNDYSNILYTADTYGYVKRWQVTISETEINLEEAGICRCHNDEITHISVIRRGEFVVTTGIDMCVRVWKADTFDYVGFFSDKSEWNIFDNNTWINETPFERDTNHFTRFFNQLGVGVSIAKSVARSFRQLPAFNQDGEYVDDEQFSTKRSSRENQDQEPFDLGEVTNMIEKYVEIGMRKLPSHISELIDTTDKIRAPFIDPEELQPSTRPVELLNNINTMLQAKIPDNPIVLRGKQRVITATPSVKQLKIPMTMTPPRMNRKASRQKMPRRPNTSFLID